MFWLVLSLFLSFGGGFHHAAPLDVQGGGPVSVTPADVQGGGPTVLDVQGGGPGSQ